MKTVPITLFVYNRPWHTKQTVEALQKNELASDSELFIYSDAPKNKGVEEKVREVREYIKTVDGFKKVTIIEREENWGLADSIIDGVTNIVNKYGKIIVLEDDLITSPYFLRFMNESLEFYKDYQQIMSISGYTYPFVLPQNYNKDVFLFYRSSSWGWAIWKDRWQLVDFNITKEHKIFSDKKLQKILNRSGEDLFYMLVDYTENKNNSWAIRFALAHALNEMYALFSKNSFVNNIGFDNSGTHCGVSNKWNVKIDKDFFPKFEKKLVLDENIVKELQKIFKITFLEKLKREIKRISK